MINITLIVGVPLILIILITQMAIGGINFAPKAFQFKSNRINLLSGLQIDRAIDLSISSLSNISIKNKLKHIPEEIRRGSSLSKELRLVKIFPAYSLTMISAGEESNQLIKVFDKLSNQLDTEVKNNIERISKLIEPSVIIIIGVIVAIIALGILSPILTLNEIV